MTDLDTQGGQDEPMFEHADADDMKGLRSWMCNVNSYLHKSGAIDAEEKKELLNLTMKATGWSDPNSDTEER